jgi:hypothetical protein
LEWIGAVQPMTLKTAQDDFESAVAVYESECASGLADGPLSNLDDRTILFRGRNKGAAVALSHVWDDPSAAMAGVYFTNRQDPLAGLSSVSSRPPRQNGMSNERKIGWGRPRTP